MAKYIRIVLTTILLGLAANFSFAYENHIYIWQRSWDSYLEDAISVIQDHTGYFTVLCGDLKVESKKPIVNLVDIKWSYLTKTETSATLAFRINTQASGVFATDDIYGIADSIKEAISKIIHSAPQDEIVGVQFDYDCPTSKLKDYATFLNIMKKHFKSIEEKATEFSISITALPTWLESSDFEELIQATDYYVLQLHSFELPKDTKQASRIFPNDRALYYAKKASSFNRPYYVSLPTYGYEIAFTRTGDFIGLRAEGMPVLWGQDVEHEVVMSDPSAIIAFMQGIEKNNPKNLLGFYWFRIPVKTDEFNWDMKTLKSVLAAKKPVIKFKLDQVSSKEGLCEIYLLNIGQQNIYDEVSFDITWPEGNTPLYDLMDKYYETKTEDGMKISGPAPYVGQKILVAWFRSFDKGNDINLKIGEVHSDENR